MFIVCEGAVCVLAVLIGATLLFAAGVMFLALKAGGGFLAPAWQKVRDGLIQLKGRRMPAELNES